MIIYYNNCRFLEKLQDADKKQGDNMKTIEIPPFAPVLMESIRAMGHNLESAVADIIDRRTMLYMYQSVWRNRLPISDCCTLKYTQNTLK